MGRRPVHRCARLCSQFFKHALYTRSAERAESPQVGPADAYRTGTHRKGFDYVGSAPEPLSTSTEVSGGGSGVTAIGGTADMQARRVSAGETWGRGPRRNESFE
jgi:hypothetical protein